MNNMEIYEATRTVPAQALRKIEAGRLKGKSDINPMWRIKSLTEKFGPCGIGWKYTIDRQWLESGGGVEQAAFVNISLYVKFNGEWSDAIPGTGGSSFVTQEPKGPYTSDECYKMALTDAISVACKALGFGADVYWEADKTKYSGNGATGAQQPTKQQPQTSPQLTTSQESFGKLQQLIDQAAGHYKTQQAMKWWFNNDNDVKIITLKQSLNADDLSAINRHFEQTISILPANGTQQQKNGDMFGERRA